jgi:hypothetical protein
MKIVDKFIKKVLAELPFAPERIEKPYYGERFTEIHRICFPQNCQYGGVLQIQYCRKSFYCIFYVVNYQLCGRYGITAQAPLAQEFRKEGTWNKEFQQHVINSLEWVNEQRENSTDVPEICRFDPLDELLNALPPEVMKYNFQRRCDKDMGKHRQSVRFEMRHNFEAELFIGFSKEKMCWMLDFSIVRHECSSRKLLDTTFDRKHTFFELYADYVPEYKADIIQHISEALIWLYNIKTPGWQEPFPAGGKQETLFLRR